MMTDDLFKTLMKETGVRPILRDARVRTKKQVAAKDGAGARARARAQDLPTRIHHQLSTEEPPPMNPLKPLQYVAYHTDRRALGLLDEVPFPAQFEIDLHGYTVEQAAQTIAALFLTIREKRLTHIRITHGIGRHSKDNKPILKAFVNRWLKNNPDIIAFASARRSDGGVGVVNAVTAALLDDRWQRI